jgi:hypothetical protein
MEIIIVLLTTIMAVVSPVGAALDQLAEDALRDQIAGAEELHVRIDNVPSYQILNGRVDHVRLAGRGIYPLQFPDLRIDTIDLETDTLDVDLGQLQRGELQLDEPAQAALRLGLRADDLNRFLQSAMVQQWLDQLRFNLPGPGGEREQNRYGLAHPSLEFLDGDRFRIVVDLEDRLTAESIPIEVELGLDIINGHQLELIDPKIVIEGEAAPPELIASFVEGANQQLTLRRLETSGIIARIIEFEIRNNELDIAVFAKVEPTSPFLVTGQPSEAAPTSP